jgi:OOP family OmpA-OmpF porin
MVINFPHASDEMLTNVKLNEYLDDLVDRLKTTSEKISLVGHTDSTASPRRNQALGQKRANAIKNLLIAKGLSADRIRTESKGETTPIASNDTANGRQQNRRVELTIIP